MINLSLCFAGMQVLLISMHIIILQKPELEMIGTKLSAPLLLPSLLLFLLLEDNAGNKFSPKMQS